METTIESRGYIPWTIIRMVVIVSFKIYIEQLPTCIWGRNN